MQDCLYCGEKIPRRYRADTKFCTHKHKDDYNNARKRIEARKCKALKSINDILTIGHEIPILRTEASEALKAIQNMVTT